MGEEIYYDIANLIYLKQTDPKVYRCKEHITAYWKRHIHKGEKSYAYEAKAAVVKLYPQCYGEGLRFPEPTDIYVNMMPFVMAKTFE